MRVVAGQFGGRVIASPSDKTTRPTTDRVRESMFSSLFSRLGAFDGVTVLDAFAGSGALGIEALSRGAAACTFFEVDAAARKVLEENLASLSLHAPQAHVRAGDVFAAVAGGALCPDGPFGLVLLDPPYAEPAERVAGLLEGLSASGALAAGAVVAYEHAHADAREAAAVFEESFRFAVTGQKKYGKIGVTYLEHVAGCES